MGIHLVGFGAPSLFSFFFYDSARCSFRTPLPFFSLLYSFARYLFLLLPLSLPLSLSPFLSLSRPPNATGINCKLHIERRVIAPIITRFNNSLFLAFLNLPITRLHVGKKLPLSQRKRLDRVETPKRGGPT